MINAHPEYLKANRFNHEPNAPKTAAASKRDQKADGRGRAPGMTLVPLKMISRRGG